MKELRSWHVMRDRRRHQYWRAAMVGLCAGVVALLFHRCLSIAEGLRETLLASLHEQHAAWGWLAMSGIAALCGGFVGWITARFAPQAGGSGIPHVKGVLLHVNTLDWKRILPVKFIGGVLCIGAGFSLGREGPTVQMGASVGKMLSELLRVPPKAVPRMLACGSGAGLAAAFHAPLAGFIFTIEELQREFSSLTYTMALIAAVVADIVATSVWGSQNVFHATGFPAASLTSLPICAVIGLVAGALGTLFNRLLLATQAFCHSRVQAPLWVRAAIIGLIVGQCAWWLPEIVGGGHQLVQQILSDQALVSRTLVVLVVVFAGKFLLTILSYASGVPGGLFAPMLVMGATLGLFLGSIASLALPGLSLLPASFSAIGMAAFFAAIVRAPLTGIVLVLEMTGDYHQLLPLITASMVAYAVSERMGASPIYDALLAYDLHRREPDIPAHREPVLLEFVVQQESQMDGLCIKDLPLPERCLFVSINRHGSDILPSGGTVLLRGDHITAVLSGASAAESVAKVLSLSKV